VDGYLESSNYGRQLMDGSAKNKGMKRSQK